jgi:Flp pilus assembly protein TadB
MKRIIATLLLCSLSIQLPAQNKNSRDRAEMKRLSQRSDSLLKLRLAKDSAYIQQMKESIRKLEQEIPKPIGPNPEDPGERALRQYEEIKRRKRIATVIIIGVAGLIAVIVAFTRKRREEKANTDDPASRDRV